MKGRKRLPAALLALQGSPTTKKRAKREVAKRPGEPKPPDHLNERELAEWRGFVPSLAKMGVLMPVDAFPLARLCAMQDEAVRASEKEADPRQLAELAEFFGKT